MAKLYKQKLVTVEAVEFTGENIDEIIAFCGECFREGDELRMNTPVIGKDAPKEVRSFMVIPGGWIQRNSDGTFTPCSASFLHYYEPCETS